MSRRPTTTAAPPPEEPEEVSTTDEEKEPKIWQPEEPGVIAPTGYKFWTDIEMEAVDWAWRGQIPFGALTIMMGAPGTTKSSLAARIAADFSNGTLDGDNFGTKGTVLWLSREDSARITIAPKLALAKAGPRILLIDEDDPTTTINLTSEAGVRSLEALVDSHDVRLVIVDPLMAFTQSKFSQQTNTAATIQAVTPLAALCATKNVACVGIMHTAKGKTKANIDSVAGSQGFTSTGRHVLIVGRVGPNFLVSPVKSNIGRTGHGHIYAVEYVERIDSTNERTKKTKAITASRVKFLRPSVPSEMEACLKQDAVSITDARIRHLLQVLNETGLPVDTNDLFQQMTADGTFTGQRRSFRDLVAEVVALGYVMAEDSGFGGAKRRNIWISRSGKAYLREDVDTISGPKRPRTTSVIYDLDDDGEDGDGY